MDEKPILALKKKKDSSMLKAIELVKNNEADAMVSCGNTGAMMAGGTIRLRPIEGIGRPALAAIIPSKKDPFVFLDVGANPEADPTNLMHNAILGKHYAQARLNIKQPRVETYSPSELSKAKALQILRKATNIYLSSMALSFMPV